MAARVGLLLRALPLLLWGRLDARLPERAGGELRREAEVRGARPAGGRAAELRVQATPLSPSELTICFMLSLCPAPFARAHGEPRGSILPGWAAEGEGGRDTVGQAGQSSERGSSSPHHLSQGHRAVHSSDAPSPPECQPLWRPQIGAWRGHCSLGCLSWAGAGTKQLVNWMRVFYYDQELL